MQDQMIPTDGTLELSDKAAQRLGEILSEPEEVGRKPAPALVKLLGGRLKRPERVEVAPETPFAP